MSDLETIRAAEAAVLKEFQKLVGYAERKAFFERNPSLAKTYCPSNFSAPVPATPAAPAATTATPVQA